MGWSALPTARDVSTALRWRGRRWAAVRTPRTGSDQNQLNAIACTSRDNCWAVGDYTLGSENYAFLNEAVHWNGQRWSLVQTPDPAGTSSLDSNVLAAVSCHSRSDCWAVGSAGNGNEALHWNGRLWSAATVPGGDGLLGVSCPSASCWAVGRNRNISRNQVLRWNGHHWLGVRVPDAATGSEAFNELWGIRCGSPVSCWAVGTWGIGRGTYNAILRWNGHHWLLARVPQPNRHDGDASGGLASVACTSARNCWAVGSTGLPGHFNPVGEALHWNGRRWTRSHLPGTFINPPPEIAAVNCATAADCWAVGGTTILHWNGASWTRRHLTSN